MDVSLTLNALGRPLPQSPNATNGVQGTGPGQTLRGKTGVSNWIMSSGGASTLIGGDSGDTFYVRDPSDIVIAAANSGINTVISWAPSYTLPANVQNLTVQTSSGGVGIGNSLDNILIAQGTGSFTLVAGTGNDVMIGNSSGLPGDGAGTTSFVIAKGDGNDVISNFVNGKDVVKLNGFTNLTDLSSVQSAMTQTGADVVLNLTSTETLTFRNETISQFKAADFALPAGLPNMTLRFDDEFNNFVSSPSGTQGWMTQGGNVWRTLGGNNEAEYYSDSSVGVNPFTDTNGVLNITASAGTNPLNLPYNSGIITTSQSLNFEYGFVEVSAKLPAGPGMWPALWLLPTSYGWPPEIDMMEMLGNDPTTIYVGTHSGPTNIGTTTAIHVGDTSTAFHTYAIDWEPTTITWYFDGNAIFSEATPSDMHQPMYLLGNLAVGGAGSWPGAPTSASEFPAKMSIDYVRYYASAASTAISGTSVLAPSAPVTINGVSSLTPAPVITGAPPPPPPPPAPALSTVTMSPGTGTVTAGGIVKVSLNFNAAVTVAGGTPTLSLNDGGTATYISGSGTSALVFSYTVLPGQNIARLALAQTGAIALHGATIQTASGANSDLSVANGYTPQATLQISGGVPMTQLAVSGWGNVYNPGTGTFNVTGSAGGSKITLGGGNHAVNIVGTNNTITTGNGNDSISIKGDNNTVTTGAGASTITLTGNYEVISVGGTSSGTTTINATGFGQQISSTATANVNITGTNSGTKVTLGDGNDKITLSGSGNTVSVGRGTSVINAGVGQAIVHAGGGNDTIVTLGYANLLDAGAGMNFLHGGSGNDTFVLNGAGQGLDTITGFTTSNHDLLDLNRTLAVTPFKADLTNIGYFVTSTFAGGNTTLLVDPTAGHQTPVAFAVLVGVNTSVPQMIAAGSFKLG